MSRLWSPRRPDVIFDGMATNDSLLAQLGNELDRLAPGGRLTRDFRVFSKLFNKGTDAATEEAAREFGKRYGCTFRHDVKQGLGIFEHRLPLWQV